MLEVLAFTIDRSRYAVPLARVGEVAPRVTLTPLPGLPPHIHGAFVYRGEVALAVDMRVRLGHPQRRPSVDDHFIMTRGRRRALAAIVDRVDGLQTLEEAAVAPPPSLTVGLEGIVALEGGLLLINDLDAVLAAEEEDAAEAAIRERMP